MKTQGTAAPGAVASAKRSGLAYKVGLGVMVTGILVVASSWPLAARPRNTVDECLGV